MAGVLDSVNQRTHLVGQNRLELLLFRLRGRQIYGINVFKVREVLPCPPLALIPRRNPMVRGVAHVRGGALSVIDLSMAIGNRPLPDSDEHFVIITEYSGATQGFLVTAVDRIVNLNWEEVNPPPPGSGQESYLTAVTDVEGQLVEIIDVEKVLAELAPGPEQVSSGVIDPQIQLAAADVHVLVVDDSAIARKQIRRCVESVGAQVTVLNDGRQALNYLKRLADEGVEVERRFLMMISDIEMPEMDGYTLTAEVRNDARLAPLHIVLHTSLSGGFNKAMVQKVGADDFLAKFNPDELGSRVAARIRAAMAA